MPAFRFDGWNLDTCSRTEVVTHGACSVFLLIVRIPQDRRARPSKSSFCTIYGKVRERTEGGQGHRPRTGITPGLAHGSRFSFRRQSKTSACDDPWIPVRTSRALTRVHKRTTDTRRRPLPLAASSAALYFCKALAPCSHPAASRPGC